MKAARLHDYGEPLVLEEIPTPAPGPGEVLVKVEGAGFCHSDLHVMSGEIRMLPRLPMVLGHENAGTVAEVGAGVVSVRVGDPVAVYGAWGCGVCRQCVAGEEQLCATPEWVGLSQHDGGYAEYLLVPRERHLVELRTLEPRAAASLTDAALTPYRAVKKVLPYLSPEIPALMIGLGGLGQYGLKMLRRLSGGPVAVVEVDPKKRELARELGARWVLDGADPRVGEEIAELSSGLGVAAALDFVGSDATLELAVGATGVGGKVVQIGLGGGAARIAVLESMRFEVSFEVSLWGSLAELREVLALVENGEIEPIPQEYAPLEAIQEVSKRLAAGEVEGRAVIVPNG